VVSEVKQPLGDNPLTRRRDKLIRSTAETVPPKAPSPSSSNGNLLLKQFCLQKSHDDRLSDLCYQVRKQTGYALKRSEVVRALIEMLPLDSLPFHEIRQEGDLAHVLEAFLRLSR